MLQNMANLMLLIFITFFPLWTFSILDYFDTKNIPIIMSLHNYRLIWEQLGFFKKDRDKYGYFQDSFIKSFFNFKIDK